MTNVATIDAPPSPPLARRVLGLAWPVLALNSLVLLVDLSDRYLVGNQPATAADASRNMLAAQGTAHYVAWFVSSFTVLVSVGAAAVVARCVGAGDRIMASRAAQQAVVLAIVVGAFGSIVALATLPHFIGWLGLDGPSAHYAALYLQPMFLLLTFRVVEVAGVASLVGAGDTRTGLWVQGTVAVVNLPMAWILCRGLGTWPGLGFVGVPLATAICYAAAAIAVLAVLARGRAGLQIHWRGFVPDIALLRRLLHVSVPAAADSLSIVLGQMWFLHIVNRLGPTAAGSQFWRLAGRRSAIFRATRLAQRR